MRKRLGLSPRKPAKRVRRAVKKMERACLPA
jgi:hypothetical protein